MRDILAKSPMWLWRPAIALMFLALDRGSRLRRMANGGAAVAVGRPSTAHFAYYGVLASLLAVATWIAFAQLARV